MNLRRAKEYIEKALPVLTEHIREKYHPDFVAPEIEFDNNWWTCGEWGEYNFTKGKIRITRNSRISAACLAYVLTHELGHALSSQINPKFWSVNFSRDRDYHCLNEGIANVFGEEGLKILAEKKLYTNSILANLRVCLNIYLNPTFWIQILRSIRLPYFQGEEAVKKLIEKDMSLEDIMQQAHDHKFAHSISNSCESKLDKDGNVVGLRKENREDKEGHP